jgi:type I restriction enzyme R subunit
LLPIYAQKELFKGVQEGKSKKHLDCEEMQDDLKHALTSFIKLYSFLTQIMPFHDAELEKQYAYGCFLLKKLPKKSSGDIINLQDELVLEYYRLQKMQENASLVLEDQVEYEVTGITSAGMRSTEEEEAALSEIINVLNERFGTEFQEADRLFLDQVEEDLVASESLAKQANSNTLQNFEYGFDDVFVNALISRMSQNQEIFAKIMDDKDFSSTVKEWMLKEGL